MLIVCPNCDASFELDTSLLEPSGRRLECSECSHSWFCGVDGLPSELPVSDEQTAAKDAAAAVADGLADATDDTGEDKVDGDVAEALSALDDEDVKEATPDAGGDTSDDVNLVDDVSKPRSSEDEENEDNDTDANEDGEGDEKEDEDLEAKIREHEARVRRRRQIRSGGGRSSIAGWLVLLLLLGGGAWGGHEYRSEVVAYYPPSADIYYRLGWLRPLGEGLKILPARTETLESQQGEKTLLIVGEIYNTLTGSQDVLDIPLLRGALIDGNDREVRVWTFNAARERILPNERVTYRTEIGDPPSNVRALVITFARPGED